MSDRAPERMSDRRPERMSDRRPERMSDRRPGRQHLKLPVPRCSIGACGEALAARPAATN
jgi:hypothetical protein